jgi:hypothetical protein
MDYAAFEHTLKGDQPPANLSNALQALWWDAKGDWDRAHACAQAQDDPESAWVHAYLHRKEGDRVNASYWYRRAGKPAFAGTLAEEWDALVRALL